MGRLSALREMSSPQDYSSTPLSRKLGAKPDVDVVVFFTTRREELERRFPALKATMRPADGLWVARPKKASKIETDLDFDTVQRIDAGLVDNKSAAIDDLWRPSASSTGSRIVSRTRPEPASSAGRRCGCNPG